MSRAACRAAVRRSPPTAATTAPERWSADAGGARRLPARHPRRRRARAPLRDRLPLVVAHPGTGRGAPRPGRASSTAPANGRARSTRTTGRPTASTCASAASSRRDGRCASSPPARRAARPAAAAGDRRAGGVTPGGARRRCCRAAARACGRRVFAPAVPCRASGISSACAAAAAAIAGELMHTASCVTLQTARSSSWMSASCCRATCGSSKKTTRRQRRSSTSSAICASPPSGPLKQGSAQARPSASRATRPAR